MTQIGPNKNPKPVDRVRRITNRVFDVETGGDDAWTNYIVGSDFSTSSTTPVDVTGLAFALRPQTNYLVEVYLILDSEDAITTTEPTIAIPSGVTRSGHWMGVTANP